LLSVASKMLAGLLVWMMLISSDRLKRSRVT